MPTITLHHAVDGQAGAQPILSSIMANLYRTTFKFSVGAQNTPYTVHKELIMKESGEIRDVFYKQAKSIGEWLKYVVDTIKELPEPEKLPNSKDDEDYEPLSWHSTHPNALVCCKIFCLLLEYLLIAQP